MLRANGVIVDAIMIGEGRDNHLLRAIAKATGGYAFAPQTLTEALNINELETMISVTERPILEIATNFNETIKIEVFADLEKFPINICNRESVPSRKMPVELNKPVTNIKNAIEILSKDSSVSIESEIIRTTDTRSNTTDTSGQRTRRILKELRSLMNDPHPNFDIYPNQNNVGFWQMVMEVDQGSHYSGGTWLLYIEFPPDYPLRAPEIRFVTPIRHSNVNQYGKICHSIFNRNWTADTSMQIVLNCIYGLMLNPDTDDPLDTNLALSFFSATGDYEAKIFAHVDLYAKKKNRQDWKREFEEN
jgi:ubiquitin-protein ligase